MNKCICAPSTDSSRGQQQLFFRPADQQWYFQAPGQQAQPLQQQQFQVGGFPQQPTATDSAGGGSPQTTPQFQFGHSQAPNQQQQQSSQQPIFFQQQFDAPSNPSATAQGQFFSQNQQFQFAGPPPPGPSPPQPQQQQFTQQFSQPQFQQFPQAPPQTTIQQHQFKPQFQQLQFPQQFQQPAALNWFVSSSGPGEFQEQLPELIRPPQTLIQRADPQPPQQQQQQQFIPQQEFSLPQPPLPPPPPPQLFQQPFFIPNNRQPNQTPNQQQIAPPVPPPRIVHIRTQQEFRDILPQLFQMPVLAEQITPSSRIGTAAPRRPPPPSHQRIAQQQRKLLTAVTSRRPPPFPPSTTTIPTTTTTQTHPPPPPAMPLPAPMLVKEEKEPLEFDLPPPPPARFLPEGEKIRIAEFLRQQQSRTKNVNKSVHAGLITDFPTLIRTITPPAPTVTIQKAPRRSTLARLAAVANQEVGDGIERNPNKVFLDCCKRKRVAKQCESRCNFDVLNKKILTGMFLGSDKCPAEHGLDLFTCAAQDQDHTECCRQSQVHKTSAADKCLAFCNLAPDAPKIQLDASYLPCWAVLNEVKSCFRENILNKSASIAR